MTTLSENTVTIKSDTVHYWANDFAPDRPSLIMIHGFRGDHHGLLKIAEPLASKYNLFIPDLPGFGRTAPLTGKTHNLSTYADFLSSFIKSLKLDQKPSLFGHSFGTTIVSAFASQHGAEVDKIILLSPIAAKPTPRALDFSLRLLRAVPERAGKKLTGNRLVSDAMTHSTATTSDPSLRNWIKLEHRAHFNDFATHKTMMEAMIASNTHHVAEFASRVPNQTLIIAGDKDKIGKSKAQAQLGEKFQNAKTKIIPGVGHLTHYEVPEKVARKIKKFI